MGHAGAWMAPGEPSAAEKKSKLERVGVTLVDHPAKFGNTMKTLLSGGIAQKSKIVSFKGRNRAVSVEASNISQGAFPRNQQQRGMHTLIRRPTSIGHGFSGNDNASPGKLQSRNLVMSSNAAKQMITDKGYNVSNSPSLTEKSAIIAITVSRARRCPSIYASPGLQWRETRSFPVNYNQGPNQQILNALLEHTGFEMATKAFQTEFQTLMHDLLYIFKASEAVSLEVVVSQSQSNDADHSGLHVTPQRFVFDDAAINSAQRQTHLLEARDMGVSEYQPVELEASKHGIVYVKLTPNDSSANIGTLVNGAGLAMNTVDALALRGGRPANFLDTGGKATAETVKNSFEAVLADERVTVIFVNIFGGLTLCNMIADGVMLAFKELGEKMRVPVVVRLRGTNEEMGQKMIAESGLDLLAYDDFEEAAAKVIELANTKS